MSPIQARQPQGTPTGGEYASSPRAEADVTLCRPYAQHTPRQVDELLADLSGQHAEHSRLTEANVATAHRILGHRKAYGRGLRNGGWPTDPDQALTDLEQALEAGTVVSYEVRRAREVLTEAEDLRSKLDDLVARMSDLDDEHAVRRWSRFFLVTSSAGGHIHSTRGCHTCRPTTTFGWLPQLSGKTEPDAVADQGAILCTDCYPSAPVEWTRGKVAADACPGSGQQPAGETRRYARAVHGDCPVCGEEFPVGYGGIRKHKTKK